LPFALAVVLFVPRRPHNVTWWVGLGTFIAFLPNAPYVLTDVIHLSGQARRAPTFVHVAALVTEYALFMGAGLVLYGGCLFLLRRPLPVDGLERWRSACSRPRRRRRCPTAWPSSSSSSAPSSTRSTPTWWSSSGCSSR